MANEGAGAREPLSEAGYFTADLGGLGQVAAGWRSQGDDIDADGSLLAEASHDLRGTPVTEFVTADYFGQLSSIFHDFYRHNQEMARYAADHGDRVAETGRSMADLEDELLGRFSGGGGR